MPGLRQTIWRGGLVEAQCGRGGSASKLGSEYCISIYAERWGREMVPANSLFMEEFLRDICPTDSLSSVPQDLSKC